MCVKLRCRCQSGQLRQPWVGLGGGASVAQRVAGHREGNSLKTDLGTFSTILSPRGRGTRPRRDAGKVRGHNCILAKSWILDFLAIIVIEHF